MSLECCRRLQQLLHEIRVSSAPEAISHVHALGSGLVVNTKDTGKVSV